MSDLILVEDQFKEIVEYLPDHAPMLKIIEEGAGEIHRASSLFGKSQSQYMDNYMTVSHHTPHRNLRQILAEMEQTKSALRDNFFKHKKKQIEIARKKRDLKNCEDYLDREMIEVEIMEFDAQREEAQKYISGAIRKLANYQTKFNEILESMGCKNFNEIDFEKEEERDHIIKAFDQGLAAARSRGGVIDEGNFIYFAQIGVNGQMAQAEILGYLKYEQGLIQSENHENPTIETQLKFLDDMAKKYAGCSKIIAKKHGMSGEITEVAALKSGDVKYLKGA